MPIVFADDFPARLIEARAQTGMTQQELADALSISRKSLSRYESGQSLPRPATLLALADTLQVDPGWLTGADEVDRNLIQDEIERLEHYPREATGMPVHLDRETRMLLLAAARKNGRTMHDELLARLDSTFYRSHDFYADVLSEVAELIRHTKNKGEG